MNAIVFDGNEKTISAIKSNSKDITIIEKFNTKRTPIDLIEEKNILIIRTAMKCFISIACISSFCYIWSYQKPQWGILLYLNSWSFFMNMIYVISITIIDIILLIKK